MPDKETCPCGSGLVYDNCCSSSSEYEGVDSIELFKEIVRSDRRREAKRQYNRQYYLNMTEGQRERQRAISREHSRIRWANMTEEEKERHRAYCREYSRRWRQQKKDPAFTTGHREHIR